MTTTFFSHRALVSQRSSGYRNTAYALSELIDNAFDAQAKEVRVIMLEHRDPNNRKYIHEILICDNGYGMSESELQYCLQFGGGINVDLDEIICEKKKGKFGYGLPNASLSQCPCVFVYTWQEKEKYKSVYLDIDELKEAKTIDIPVVGDAVLPPYYTSIGAVVEDETGVIVSWRRCDRLSNTRAGTIVDKSEELLGRLFRYLLSEGKKIVLSTYEYNPNQRNYVRGKKQSVKANDPTFLIENTVIAKYLHAEANPKNPTEHQSVYAKYYKPFVVSERECKATNEKVEDHCYEYHFEWQGRIYNFPIKTSVAKMDIQKPGIREGGSTKVGSFYAKKDSINFVRADREIASGPYGFYKSTEHRNRWWTIEVMFDASADDLLGVHNNKQGIEFEYTKEFDPTEEWDKHTATLQQARERLWYELTNKIELARKAAWKRVLNCHKEWDLMNTPNAGGGTDSPSPIPEATPTATTIATQVDGRRKQQFTEEERTGLAERLQEKYPALSANDINRSISKYDRALARGCVLYHSSEAEAFWSVTTVYDFLIVLINTEHEFYRNVIAPLRVHKFEAALAAIELFISSLAWEEVNHFSESKQKDTIEQYRSYVGLHLNRYIRELNITEDDFVSLTESAENR